MRCKYIPWLEDEIILEHLLGHENCKHNAHLVPETSLTLLDNFKRLCLKKISEDLGMPIVSGWSQTLGRSFLLCAWILLRSSNLLCYFGLVSKQSLAKVCDVPLNKVEPGFSQAKGPMCCSFCMIPAPLFFPERSPLMYQCYLLRLLYRNSCRSFPATRTVPAQP